MEKTILKEKKKGEREIMIYEIDFRKHISFN